MLNNSPRKSGRPMHENGAFHSIEKSSVISFYKALQQCISLKLPCYFWMSWHILTPEGVQWPPSSLSACLTRRVPRAIAGQGDTNKAAKCSPDPFSTGNSVRSRPYFNLEEGHWIPRYMHRRACTHLHVHLRWYKHTHAHTKNERVVVYCILHLFWQPLADVLCWIMKTQNKITCFLVLGLYYCLTTLAMFVCWFIYWTNPARALYDFASQTN